MCVNLTFNSHGLSPKGSPLEALREAARLRRKEGYRPGSRKNLISCQTLFIQFALVYDVDLYAPRLDDFGAFAELLLISGRSPATVKNYLSAIKSLFQEWRATSVVKDLTSPAWTLTLRAISYSAGPQPDNRSAITLEDLTRLVAVCNTDPSLVPLRVALVFGFLGYLRISNMTPPTAQSFDPTRHTSWADVRPCEQGLLLDLKWTKTLQTQHGVTTIPLSSLLDQRICPVAAWNLYRHMLPGVNPSRTTPLLLTTAPPIGKTISASTLRAMFHRATLAAGLSDKNYTPHSLRRGGASFCFQVGVPLEHIKKHGTWSSQAVDRYLLQHQAFQTPVALAFRQQINGSLG